MKPIETHRCKELLEYNKNNYKPCAIQYSSFFSYLKEKPAWILKSLDWSNEDWDVKWMDNIARIRFCPFCGKKLEEVNNGNRENN